MAESKSNCCSWKSNESRRVKYILDLPYNVLSDMCTILDINDKWKHLGGTYLGFTTTDIMRIKQRAQHSDESSYAMVMLMDWGQQNHTVDEIFLCLGDMKMYSVMSVLKPHVSPRLHGLLDDGLTEPTSNATCWIHHHHQRCLPKPPLPSTSSSAAAVSRQSRPPPVQDTAYDLSSSSYVEDSEAVGGSRPGLWFRPPPAPASCNDDDLCRQYDKMYVDPYNVNECSSVAEKVTPPKLQSKVIESEWSRLPRPPLPYPSMEDNTRIPTPAKDAAPQKTETRSNDEAPAIGQIPYSDMVDATNNFTTRILGRGGFGTVYEGTWMKAKVAIKRIEKKDNPGMTSLEEAKLRQSYVELKTLTECRYDNVLALYGYAVSDGGLCLMYEYMANGSLEDRLRRHGGTAPLSWKRRLSIASGAARGVQYLHGRDPRIIHGDIKSANILLDANFRAKIGDFGLAREGPASELTHTTVTAVHGTQPYLPPDFIRSRQLSTKVDTYSFGVVLFELATGLRAYDQDHGRKPLLRDLVAEHDDVETLRDGSAGDDPAEVFLVLVRQGRSCTSSKKKKRPEMSDVFEHLDAHLQDLENANASSDTDPDGPPLSSRNIPNITELASAFGSPDDFPPNQ